MTTTNEAERRRWNDETWTAVWPKRERLTDAVTPVLLEAVALRPGERALDIGCGGGRTSVAAARAVAPDGQVVGADVSAQLLELAQSRAHAEHRFNVTFHQADVQTDAIPGAPFDVALSQFGVMFFDEPVAAFANIRAQLRSGGRLAFACWQAVERNPWFPVHAAAPFLPPPPEPAPGKSPAGPFTLADPEHTRGILEEAGFAGIERTPHELEVDVPVGSIFDDVQLRFLGVPEDQLDAARTTVEDYLSRFELGAGELLVPLAFQIFTAQAPSS